MDLLLVALLVLAVGGVVVVALGRVGGGLAPADPGLVPPLDHEVRRPADLDRARFTLALRGYRMDQVDTVLDEARDLLAAKDEEIARLRRLVPVDDPPVTPAPVAAEPSPIATGASEPAPVVRPADPAPSDPAPSDPSPAAAAPVDAVNPRDPVPAEPEPRPVPRPDAP